MAASRTTSCLFTGARRIESSLERQFPIRCKFIRPNRNPLLSRVILRHRFTQSGPRPRGMEKLRQAYKEHPILLPAGFVTVFLSFVFLGYVNYVYMNQVIAFHRFPEPVAKELKKAIYFDTGPGQDPKKAFQYYREAIMVAQEVGLNPYTEEFQGIRVQVAGFLEKHHQYEQAIAMLEKEREACYSFVERTGDKYMASGARTRILGMAVKLGVKIGQMYSMEAIENPEAAQAAFVMAVETLLRERQRRERDGVKENEGEWLSNEEIGATLEELGHTYVHSKQPEFALPLYLQSLSLCDPKSCHSAMLMNSISAAVSSQRPEAALIASEQSIQHEKQPIPSAAELRRQAKKWAEKALSVAQSVEPPARDSECDMACAVTTHNLAELADMSGDKIAARRLFQEAKTLSKAINFQQGVEEASVALARLQAS